MRKRNGFTLIELLAIIVILAIIAVITVPIILGIIDNSKKGAAIDSAYGYKEAIQKFYALKMLEDSNYKINDDEYDINYYIEQGIDVNGEKPSDGWVMIENNNVTDFSLKIGEYAVTYRSNNNTIEAIKNGEVVLTLSQQAKKDAKDKALAYANDVKINKGNVSDIFNLPVEGVSSTDVTDGWVALKNGQIIGYSLQVGEYVVTYDGERVSAVKGTDIASSTLFLQSIVSYKVDSYMKAILETNLGLNDGDEIAKNISDISVTNNKADSGWIRIKNISGILTIIDYSLQYSDVVANYSSLTDGNYVSTFGESRNKPVIIPLGSEVCLTETDCFKVIEINGETATLLADNNINTSTRMQGENGQHYPVAFSGTNYWNVTGQTYPVDIYDSTKNAASGTNYSVAYYVNQYVSNLQNMGINVTSGRILTKSEVESGGIAYSYRSSAEYYWLGTALGSSNLYYWDVRVSNSDYIYSYSYGVRPVIYIGTSDI